MPRPKSYRDLIVWQKAMTLARQVYVAINEFPKHEILGLAGQIRRAAVSIPSNIAEGHGRLTDAQFRHFLGNARGSLCEMQTQLELATDLGYLKKETMQKLIDQGSEVARLLNGLIASMRSATPANRTSSANPASTASSARTHVS